MKRRIAILLALCLCFNFGYAKKKKGSLALDPSKVEWFKDAKFGMFIHWGLYSMLEGTYDGVTLPDTRSEIGNSWYAEWIQARLNIPNSIYHKLADEFNPVNFDADKWILDAKNAGMKYFVITAKHHDGFALWDTKYSDFNIMNTPYGKDILQQLVDACKKYDMKYGFYYSHWQDWEHPGGAVPYWKTTRPDKEFEKYWKKKSLPQVKELIKKYDPDLLWFDTWDEVSHITDERRDELIALVRENSDKCLINGRISYYSPGSNIDFLEMHDNNYPDEVLMKPWQTPATMQHSWGYHAKDFNWKSSNRMLGYLVNNISKGGNYLLNVGPMGDGAFPKMAIKRLGEMGAWIGVNSEAIYGTRRVNYELNDKVFLTQRSDEKNEYLYVFMTEPTSEIILPIALNGITKCELLETGRPIDCGADFSFTKIFVPEKIFIDGQIQVLKITYGKKISQ